ncbi:MAG TPA: hypothetical protein VNZ49_05250 [Bacteroidia bacterium]|jgi:hypothetical protein|nr:hypothetical protein [Bacteroidia bacterium]
MKEVKTRTAKIFIDENDILHFVMVENVHLDFDDAIDNALVIKRLTNGEPSLKLVDTRVSWTIDKKAQTFLRSNEVKEKTIARAVVKNSAFDAMLVNFFAGLSKPKVPTKIFTDYDEAYKWLLSLKRA